MKACLFILVSLSCHIDRSIVAFSVLVWQASVRRRIRKHVRSFTISIAIIFTNRKLNKPMKKLAFLRLNFSSVLRFHFRLKKKKKIIASAYHEGQIIVAFASKNIYLLEAPKSNLLTLTACPLTRFDSTRMEEKSRRFDQIRAAFFMQILTFFASNLKLMQKTPSFICLLLLNHKDEE